MAEAKLLLLFLSCGLAVLPGQPRAVFPDYLTGLEDTLVPLGEEPPAAHSVFQRAALLEEVMGPLSRNVRAVDEQTRSLEVYKRMRVLLSLLRMHIGASPHVDILHFQNWDKTIQINQLFYIRVKTVFELRRVIRAARSLGMRLRATGYGHSRSPLYVDEGNIMLDVRELERHDGPKMQVNQPTAERPFKTLTAMTGIIEVELNAFMTENRVGILGQPLNDQESLGGMVSASTHGSTWEGMTYSGIVVEMRLMDSRGRLRRFTKEKHPELMKAASCSLGMFGIMYDITIQVVDTFVVKAENFFVRLGDLMLSREEIKTVVTGNFLTEMSWFPFNSVRGQEADEYNRTGKIPVTWKAENDEVWLRHINPVTDMSEVQGQDILGPTYMPTGGSLSGGNVKGLLRGQGAVDIAKRLQQKTFHYLVNAFPVILPPRWGTETSAAFMLNIDNDFDRVARAFEFLINKTEAQIKARGTQPLNALLPRFHKSHSCFICPGNTEITMPNDSGKTLVIDFLAPPTQEGFYPAAADFLEHFKDEKVRPHWAKRHDNIVGIIDHIQRVYGDLLTRFTAQKRYAQVDPCDMFMNSYLLAIFGRSTSCY